MKHEVIRVPNGASEPVIPSVGAQDVSPSTPLHVSTPVSTSGQVQEERFERIKETRAVKLGKRIRKPLNRFLARFSTIATTPIIDPAPVPGIELLRANWQAIAAEARAVLAERDAVPAFAKISPDHRRIAPSAKWKSFFFKGYGYDSPMNRAKCPQTAALVDRIPNVVVAFYSVFEPGTDVPSHHGVTKAMLNVHLGLSVPGGSEVCGIKVDGEDHGWREGELFVFDETYEHEAWNHTDRARVILFLQVMRPMRWPGRLLGKLFLAGVKRTSYVQDVRKAIGA
ncbi:aspartyl/asparaginyl beta-hydroxylase domain-containing protein [Novosphingobium sp. 9]|uniref:aspartyl/asparaginyl beta-hydroxylase domain-containing protein n=1 Tax=Novosphingobium sp. 9 TaxID=2025349 RepID=UPI0021B52412|nr:aspartyl/asparaginyl beta-hydroxylase domain-containing protein [Novosphingobium sp. 9]